MHAMVLLLVLVSAQHSRQEDHAVVDPVPSGDAPLPEGWIKTNNYEGKVRCLPAAVLWTLFPHPCGMRYHT